ncbi:MAG: sterol desaturase family protein [Bauldia sp.]|nr:sterol desaturase family protein [Bauldia sp.]
MRLGKVGYYSDFVVYPVAIAGMASFALWRTWPDHYGTTLAAFVVGVAIWTLVEYVMHRYVLHHLPGVREMHEAHHREQAALIGTPIWLSLILIFGLVYVPLYLAVPAVAGGLTAGFMLGYLWYVSVHHLIHHGGLGRSALAMRLKRRHMLHHHFNDEGNYGVTSGFWDKVFGTDIQVRGSRTGGNSAGS